MSWYKEITISSKNVQLGKDSENWVDGITNEIVNRYLHNGMKNDAFTTSISNPYKNNQIINLNIALLTSGVSSVAIADYMIKNNQNYLRINLNQIRALPQRNIFQAIKLAIQHELVHAFDPTMDYSKSVTMEQNKQEYLSSIREFNAYCLQISEEVKTYLKNNPNIKSLILNL